MQSKITKITAEEIRDSRENPTIKVTVFARSSEGDREEFESFSVPSGASTGTNEAYELRDDDGRGVEKAINKINEIISPALIGQDVLNQKMIDEIMIDLDSSPNKKNLGGNSIIGVSTACAKVAAKLQGMETFEYLRTLKEIRPSRKVPYLFMNLINGGKHAKNEIAFQEYHIVPECNNVNESVEIGVRIWNSLKEIIKKDLGGDSILLGDEGGFAPKISDIRKPIFYLKEAIKINDLKNKVHIALDVAASSFFKNNLYEVDGDILTKEGLSETYDSLINEFDIFSIEDPFYEDDFESFRHLKETHKNLFVVGDDLTVSNKDLLQKAIRENSVNAIIIKPNQIGTLSEVLETMKLARDNDIELIVSHRSGETDDDFIADLAFAFGCFGLKTGAPLKPERKVKYDRLIKIAGKQD